MSIPQIVVRNLSKTYRVPEREAGLIASIVLPRCAVLRAGTVGSLAL